MLRVCLVVMLVQLIPLAAAHACDRALSPLEPPEVAVAVADVVIVGKVEKMEGAVATVKVVTGVAGGLSPGDSLRVGALRADDDVDRCGPMTVGVGKTYVMMLWRPRGTLATYHLVDPYGGIQTHTPATETRYRTALATRHAHSPWHDQAGVATQLVLDADPAHPGDVDLVVILRNTGGQPVRFTYRDWPRATQSRCALDVVHTASKTAVPARPVPIAPRDISDYFSRHGRKYEVELAPGAAHTMRLERVTTAKPGWGHKEALGFAYYPIATAGPHRITADCVNLLGKGSRVRTAPLELVLAPSP
jgi:hypothetical protein